MALSLSGKQITAARALADLTVAELAERAGLSRDAIMKIEAGIKGMKCPLQAEHLRAHAALVREIWNEAAAFNPQITAWLNKVELVGYSEPLYEISRPPPPLRKAA
jgi:transcriptional regulator with XRE-family HTH domain